MPRPRSPPPRTARRALARSASGRTHSSATMPKEPYTLTPTGDTGARAPPRPFPVTGLRSAVSEKSTVHSLTLLPPLPPPLPANPRRSRVVHATGHSERRAHLRRALGDPSHVHRERGVHALGGFHRDGGHARVRVRVRRKSVPAPGARGRRGHGGGHHGQGGVRGLRQRRDQDLRPALGRRRGGAQGSLSRVRSASR